MHRALLLPEIVQTIIRAGKNQSGLLYSCLFVNKIFFHEACRILWKGSYGGFSVGHPSPSVGDLGRMVVDPEIGRDRAQIYANHVRVLVFRDVRFMGMGANEDGRPGGHLGEDAQWHLQLCQLEFPLLEDLNIGRTRSAQELNTESVILHYVHSGLRDLRVDACAPVSDHFLDEVSRLGPYLQQLDMDFRNATITKEGLARFLKQMRHLEGIHVAALDKSWSAAAFAAVARYGRLELLHVPSMNDTWFDTIELSSSFPALKQLYTLRTTGKALLRLSHANAGLEVIHLYNDSLSGREDVLSAISNFPLLTAFKYQPNSSETISGRDLVALARGCRNLTSFAIGQITLFPLGFGQNTVSNPFLAGVDDGVVYSIAQNLPHLRNLQLIGRYEPFPSLKGVMSAFNQHCPLLETLEISCGSDWCTFGNPSPQQWSFARLKVLDLNPQVHMDDTLSDLDIRGLLQQFKSSAPTWFPAIEYFNIKEADDREQDFIEFMYEVADKIACGSDEEDSKEGYVHDVE
jgi:hypothetical protein